MITRKKDEIEKIINELGIAIDKASMASSYDIYGNKMNIAPIKHDYLHHRENYNLQRASKFGVGNWKGGHLI